MPEYNVQQTYLGVIAYIVDAATAKEALEKVNNDEVVAVDRNVIRVAKAVYVRRIKRAKE